MSECERVCVHASVRACERASVRVSVHASARVVICGRVCQVASV